MSSDERFVAQILEASADGYAGLATSLLFESSPDLATRYGSDGFSGWKAQIRQWMIDLSAALDAGEPGMFESRVLWSRQSFQARRGPVQDLKAALTAMIETLRERLPGGSADGAVRTLERAREAVERPRPVASATIEDAERPATKALAFLESILSGRSRDAIDDLIAAVDRGASVRDTILEVFVPAQREVGRMWQEGQLSIAEEHLITTTTRRLLALLCERARSSESNGKTVLLASVAGDSHELGLLAISVFFEMEGWRVVNLGADVPGEEVARGAELFDADLLLLSATLDPHLKQLQRTIEQLRALDRHPPKILVGGPVLAGLPDHWRKLGADGYCATLEDAELLGSELTRGETDS